MEQTADNTSCEDGSKKGPFDDLSKDELIKKCKGLLAIAQKAKQAKSDLHNEVENLKLKLEECETEKKISESNVKTLQELVDSLTEQKLNYITEIDTAQNKVRVLSEKFKAYEDEVGKYKSELATKDKKINEVTVQLSDFDSEVTSLKRQNNRLVEENEQLLSQLTDLEARTEEFNKIGLQQMEQLRLLEERVNAGNTTDVIDRDETENMSRKIQELESELETKINSEIEYQKNMTALEDKLTEVSQQYESEKDKKEKANIRLRSYKDKILKCAACINQLKNSRFILTRTVKEYSESIPKWQNDIIKASKFLDTQINELSNENNMLKGKLKELEKKINEFTGTTADNVQNKEQSSKLSLENQLLQDQLIQYQQQQEKVTETSNNLNTELQDLKPKYEDLKNCRLPALAEDNDLLKQQVQELIQKSNEFSSVNNNLKKVVLDLESENKKLNQSIHNLQKKVQETKNNEAVDTLTLQIKALESEKAILVKEKLNARDSVLELENQNKILTEQLNKLNADLQSIMAQHTALHQEKTLLAKNAATESQTEISNLKSEMMVLREQYDLLKKEHENVTDLNGLLRDEVETLKLSLEQPKYDVDNLSDLNVSFQTDIVKLETKLAAYKQENASLLAEVKESRSKIKDIESITADYEDAKSKLLSYKTENTELLNEMKEINQVLKERGEAISKLQKAIAEMEKLVETLEKNRDDANQERDNLQKKVNTLENDLKTAEQNITVSTEAVEQIVIARDNALKAAQEKDSVISALREEIEKLKQQQNQNMDLTNEDNMSTSTTSRAEEYSRMKDLDESFEEKYSKLRIFALKLKKKLNETNIQLENSEKDKAKLEKIISDNASKNPQPSDKIYEMNTNDESKITKNEVFELEGKVKSLTNDLEASKGVTVELEKLKVELANKTEQLKVELEAHKATKDSLEKVRRDVKKKSVLSLEIEDYERSMKELTTKIEDNKKKMVQMESTIDTQEGTITAMKTQIKLLEEQIKSEETQNRLAKEEIQHVIEEGKEKDNVIQVKNGIISKLELDLEDERRKNEEVNIEMTSILGEKEKAIISLGEEKIELNNKLKRIEFKCADLEEKMRITNIELEDLKTEYTSYKVRAQAVLRQNQTVDHSQEEQLKEDAAVLRAQIDSLTAKLSTAQEKCTELQSAAELERRRSAEATSEVGRAAQRTARLQADLSRVAAQLDVERSQHKLQVSTLTQCYKSQISDLEAKLQKEAEEFQKQLAAAQEKLKTGVTVVDRMNRNDQFMPVIPKEEGSDGEMDINVSMPPREEGEGSEAAPSPPLSKSFLVSGGSGRSPVPLERLLEEGVPEDERLDTSSMALTPDQELADLRRKLQAQQQRVKHVTVLLSESERECARYLQMNELLKTEVRRARGSLERTQHAHNAEYMKNVTLKFLTLPPGDERSRLVPVLQKILTLTSEETHKLNAVAKGMDPNPTKGWGSYLPWPGGK